MSVAVVAGASLMCPFASGPGNLLVTSQLTVMAENKPIGTIKDCAFPTNVPPFPLCSSPTNPTVIAATAAKLGVFTPAACVPQFLGPWLPEQVEKTAGGSPCLTQGCKMNCAWGGVISITNPGQTTVIL